MITKLQNPIVATALGLVVSIALGVALCWRAAGPLLTAATAAAAAHTSVVVAEKKAKGWDFWTVEIDNLSSDLKDERLRLHKESEELDQRAARLAAQAKELEKARSDIEGLRLEITGKVAEIGADEAKNLRTLSQTYTNLTPRAAVAILREMDDLTAVKILSLMKPDVVGAIFEEMSHTAGTDGPLAKRAAILSEKIRLMKAGKAPTST